MKKFNLKYQIAAGVLLVVIGTLALLSDYIKEKRDVVFSEMNLILSPIYTETDTITDEEVVIEETEEDIPSNEEIPVIEEVKEEKPEKVYEEYLGILEIPKIGFYRGFYNKNSNLNKVKFNLYVLPESTYPDTDKGNLMIAGHSGNYNNSYFKDLYKLDINDTVMVHYNNKKYTYNIVSIYYEEKDGDVRIIRDKEKTVLTLITCTKDSKTLQTIYIAELVNIE